jgi:hypothetical protein
MSGGNDANRLLTEADMKLTYTLLSLSAVLLLAGSAEAASVINRFSATACAYETDYDGDYVISVSGIANNSGGINPRARTVFCPLNDANTVEYLAVDGYDANNDPTHGVPTARICQADNFGLTVSCTASTALLGGTSTGFFSTWLPSWMLAPLKDPARASWYADLVISLPPPGIYGKSFLRGFFRT